MSLVTVDVLRKYMSDITLTDDQWSTAQLVIDGVQEELERYLHRPVEPVLVRETILSDNDGFLVFSVTPIHKVISINADFGVVTQFGIPLPITQEPLDTTGFKRFMNNVPENYGAPFTSPGGVYMDIPNVYFVAEYIGGYIGYLVNDLKLAILRVASREVEKMHDDTLSIKQGIARDPGRGEVVGWMPEELEKFDGIRRRVAV